MAFWKKKGLETPARFRERVERKGLTQEFFNIITEGRFTPDQIRVVLTEPGASMARSKASEKFIETEWQRLITTGVKPWPNDTAPSRYRFVEARIRKEHEDEYLEVTLDPGVSYRDAIGSRPAGFKKFGPEYMPNPVGVTTVIRAKNKKGEDMLLVTLRSVKNDFKGGGYHVSTGGIMEIKKDASPADTAVREITEEVGLKKEELNSLVCCGVVENKLVSSSVEIVFDATTNITVEEIMSRVHDDENELLFIPATPEKMREWLVVPTHANMGITNAAVLMVGRDMVAQVSGEAAAQEWYNDLMKFLAVRSQQARKRGANVLEQRDVARLANKVKSARE